MYNCRNLKSDKRRVKGGGVSEHNSLFTSSLRHQSGGIRYRAFLVPTRMHSRAEGVTRTNERKERREKEEEEEGRCVLKNQTLALMTAQE